MHDLSPKVKKDHAWNVCFSHFLRHMPTYGWKLKKKNPDVAGSLKTKKQHMPLATQLLMWISSCFHYKVNIVISFLTSWSNILEDFFEIQGDNSWKFII